MGGDHAGSEDSDVVQPLGGPLSGELLVLVYLSAGLGQVHGDRTSDLIGEGLGLYTGLFVADIYPLERSSRDDFPLVLELLIEVLAVLDRVALLGGLVLVETAPAADSSEPRFLGGLGDDILGIVEVHEGGGSGEHHLHASDLGAEGEVRIGTVGVDLEGLV